MTVSLPSLNDAQSLSLDTVLRQRRTQRSFAAKPLSLGQVGALLWAAAGTSGDDGLCTAPSAGGLHLLSLHLVAGSITDLEPGSYRYDATNHVLDPAQSGDLRPALSAAAIGDQPWVAAAPAVLVIAADVERAVIHFADQPPPGQRGQRYAAMEAGHAAQNVYLQATALGLGTVLVGGFDDDAVADVLALEHPWRPLALMPVGHPV